MSSLEHPDHWPDPVVDTFDSVLAESPGLAGAAFSTLVEACELLASAYALDKVATAANYISTGSTGQTTAHPCLVEARLARTEASRILGRLIAPANRGQALARARHGGLTR